MTPELLRSRYDDLLLALERVTDRAELAVTALWTSPPQRAETGTAYLRARGQKLATAHRVAAELERACGDDLVAAEHHEVPSDTVALSSALLVTRDRAEMAKQRLPREATAVRILVHGPWPPYTFAALGSTREK